MFTTHQYICFECKTQQTLSLEAGDQHTDDNMPTLYDISKGRMMCEECHTSKLVDTGARHISG